MGRDAVGQTSPAVIEGMVSLSQYHRSQPPLMRLFAGLRGFSSCHIQTPYPIHILTMAVFPSFDACPHFPFPQKRVVPSALPVPAN